MPSEPSPRLAVQGPVQLRGCLKGSRETALTRQQQDTCSPQKCPPTTRELLSVTEPGCTQSLLEQKPAWTLGRQKELYPFLSKTNIKVEMLCHFTDHLAPGQGRRTGPAPSPSSFSHPSAIPHQGSLKHRCVEAVGPSPTLVIP